MLTFQKSFTCRGGPTYSGAFAIPPLFVGVRDSKPFSSLMRFMTIVRMLVLLISSVFRTKSLDVTLVSFATFHIMARG